MYWLIDNLDVVAVLSVAGVFLGAGLTRAVGPSIARRWRRFRRAAPPRPVIAVLDPDQAMEMLLDQIARSPARSRGWVVVAGTRISAYWVTNVQVRPDGDTTWNPGFWVIDIDGYQAPCSDLDVMYQVGLARLRAIVAGRAEPGGRAA